MADRIFEALGECEAVPTAQLVIATDGGHADDVHSSAYIGTDGQWGVKAAVFEHDSCKPACSLGAELRAIHYGLEHTSRKQPVRIETDSLNAQRIINRWQHRRLRMPPWYSLEERKNAQRPTLVLLRNRVAKSPLLTVVHSLGHNGELLNEAADGLATIGLNALRQRYSHTEAQRRSASLAASFLLSYRQQLLS